jgi:hypothetical protein
VDQAKQIVVSRDVLLRKVPKAENPKRHRNLPRPVFGPFCEKGHPQKHLSCRTNPIGGQVELLMSFLRKVPKAENPKRHRNLPRPVFGPFCEKGHPQKHLSCRTNPISGQVELLMSFLRKRTKKQTKLQNSSFDFSQKYRTNPIGGNRPKRHFPALIAR